MKRIINIQKWLRNCHDKERNYGILSYNICSAVHAPDLSPPLLHKLLEIFNPLRRGGLAREAGRRLPLKNLLRGYVGSLIYLIQTLT